MERGKRIEDSENALYLSTISYPLSTKKEVGRRNEDKNFRGAV